MFTRCSLVTSLTFFIFKVKSTFLSFMIAHGANVTIFPCYVVPTFWGKMLFVVWSSVFFRCCSYVIFFLPMVSFVEFTGRYVVTMVVPWTCVTSIVVIFCLRWSIFIILIHVLAYGSPVFIPLPSG